MEELLSELEKLALRKHYSCEDSWYSCPKSDDGCANDWTGEDCNCGADNHNAKVASITESIRKLLLSRQ